LEEELVVAMAHQATNLHHTHQASVVVLVVLVLVVLVDLVVLMLLLQLSIALIQTKMEVLVLQNSTTSSKVAYKKLTFSFLKCFSSLANSV
jgi:hypothetical protein